MHVSPFARCVELTSYNFAVCHNQSYTTGLNILRRKCGMEAFIARPGTMHSWAILKYGIKLQLKNFLFGREKKYLQTSCVFVQSVVHVNNKRKKNKRIF